MLSYLVHCIAHEGALYKKYYRYPLLAWGKRGKLPYHPWFLCVRYRRLTRLLLLSRLIWFCRILCFFFGCSRFCHRELICCRLLPLSRRLWLCHLPWFFFGCSLFCHREWICWRLLPLSRLIWFCRILWLLVLSFTTMFFYIWTTQAKHPFASVYGYYRYKYRTWLRNGHCTWAVHGSSGAAADNCPANTASSRTDFAQAYSFLRAHRALRRKSCWLWAIRIVARFDARRRHL